MRQFSVRYIPLLVVSSMVLFSAELRGDEPVVQVDIDAEFPTHAPRGIKFLEFGGDIPSASFVAAHIDEMAKRPLAGVVFKPVDGGYHRRASNVPLWILDTPNNILGDIDAQSP